MPEKVPLPNQQSNDADMNESHVWTCDCIDKCAITGAVDIHPEFQGGRQLMNISLLQLFLKLLPWEFFVHVIINKTLIARTDENNASFDGRQVSLMYWSLASHGHCV